MEKIADYFKGKEHSFQLSPSMFDENIDINSINETTIKETFLYYLKKDFYIKEEVQGEHLSGKKLFIDAILTPKNTEGWLNPNIKIGIEFKNPNPNKVSGSQGRGEHDMLAQCLDYSMTQFEGVENNSMIILLCPNIANKEKHKELYRFLARYNVGYLDVHQEYGIEMRLQNIGIPIWCSNKGAMQIKKSYFKKTYGVRSNKSRYRKL